jgi:hypothetical protein
MLHPVLVALQQMLWGLSVEVPNTDVGIAATTGQHGSTGRERDTENGISMTSQRRRTASDSANSEDCLGPVKNLDGFFCGVLSGLDDVLVQCVVDLCLRDFEGVWERVFLLNGCCIEDIKVLAEKSRKKRVIK